MLWEPDPAFFQTNLPKGGGGGGEATCKETANDPHLQACLTSLVKPVTCSLSILLLGKHKSDPGWTSHERALEVEGL